WRRSRPNSRSVSDDTPSLTLAVSLSVLGTVRGVCQVEGLAMISRKPRKPDTSLDTPALQAAAKEGRSNHETLYGNLARRLFKFQVFSYVFLAMVIWDRVEISRYTHEKLYAPVVLKETKDAGIEWYGTPDPAWQPEDRNIVPELISLIETVRGRTTDAKL